MIDLYIEEVESFLVIVALRGWYIYNFTGNENLHIILSESSIHKPRYLLRYANGYYYFEVRKMMWNEIKKSKDLKVVLEEAVKYI